MTVEEFLSRLEGVQRMHLDPNKHAAKCPAHADRVGSLVVTDVGDHWVVHCHANCAYGSIMLAVGAKPGDNLLARAVERGGHVNIGRVTPTAPASPPSSTPRPVPAVEMPPEHVVDFWIESLKPLHERLYELKGWSSRTLSVLRLGWDGGRDPMHPHGRIAIPNYAGDERMLGYVRYRPGAEPKMLAVGPRDLFPPPETLREGDVWLVEGEPDRVSAVELGLSACAVPGLGKWRPDWAQRFRGHRVTVCLDCDEQGRSAARERVRGLREAGVEAVVVDLWPDVSDGRDIGDLLVVATREGRVDDLRRYLMRIEDRAWRKVA